MRTENAHMRDERGIPDTLSRFFHCLREMEEKGGIRLEMDSGTFRTCVSLPVFAGNYDLRNSLTLAVIHESDIDEPWHSFRIVYSETAHRLLDGITGRMEEIYSHFRTGGWGYCHGDLFPIYPGRVERSAGISKTSQEHAHATLESLRPY